MRTRVENYIGTEEKHVQKHSKLTSMPPPCWRYGFTTLGKNAVISFCIGRDKESIPCSSYTSRARHSISHSSLALRDLVILVKSIFGSVLSCYIKFLQSLLALMLLFTLYMYLIACLGLELGAFGFWWDGGQTVCHSDIPRGSNFKGNGEDHLPFFLRCRQAAKIFYVP